jgi:hypothetical protein
MPFLNHRWKTVLLVQQCSGRLGRVQKEVKADDGGYQKHRWKEYV